MSRAVPGPFEQFDRALTDGPAERIPAIPCVGCSRRTPLDCLDTEGRCGDCAPLDSDAELSADEEFRAWLDSRSAEALEAFERSVSELEESTRDDLFSDDSC